MHWHAENELSTSCADQQFGTNFHRICEARELGNNLNVGVNYSSQTEWTVRVGRQVYRGRGRS